MEDTLTIELQAVRDFVHALITALAVVQTALLAIEKLLGTSRMTIGKSGAARG